MAASAKQPGLDTESLSSKASTRTDNSCFYKAVSIFPVNAYLVVWWQIHGKGFFLRVHSKLITIVAFRGSGTCRPPYL